MDIHASIGAKSRMHGISFVMATVGRVVEVAECIASLARQTCHEFELIVVDQNSDDRLVPVLEAAKQHGFPVIHLRQGVPNQCIARNSGIAAATRTVVAFPDDDCWYDTDVVEKILRRMEQSDQPDGMVIRWQEATPVAKEPHVLSGKKLRQFREVDTSMIVMIFRRDLFAAVGDFDVTFGLHSWYGGSEEIDLILRILAANRRVVYVPDVLVHHPLKSTLSTATPGEQFRRLRSRSRGMGGLYAKHMLAPYVVVRGLIVPWVRVIIFLFRPRLAAMHAGIAIGRLEGFLRWNIEKRHRKC